MELFNNNPKLMIMMMMLLGYLAVTLVGAFNSQTVLGKVLSIVGSFGLAFSAYFIGHYQLV